MSIGQGHQSHDGGALPWCCAHKWTMGYIAVVVTLELVLIILGLL